MISILPAGWISLFPLVGCCHDRKCSRADIKSQWRFIVDFRFVLFHGNMKQILLQIDSVWSALENVIAHDTDQLVINPGVKI